MRMQRQVYTTSQYIGDVIFAEDRIYQKLNNIAKTISIQRSIGSETWDSNVYEVIITLPNLKGDLVVMKVPKGFGKCIARIEGVKRNIFEEGLVLEARKYIEKYYPDQNVWKKACNSLYREAWVVQRLLDGGEQIKVNAVGKPLKCHITDYELIKEEQRLMQKHPGYHHIHPILQLVHEIPAILTEHAFGDLLQMIGKGVFCVMEDGNPNNLFIEAAIQIVNVMKYLHEQKCGHNDIKPENFLVTVRDGRYVYRLHDFEHAVFEGEKYNATHGGTPLYCAKERLDAIYSNEDYNPRTSDIYSVGLTLFELFGYVDDDLKDESNEMRSLDSLRKVWIKSFHNFYEHMYDMNMQPTPFFGYLRFICIDGYDSIEKRTGSYSELEKNIETRWEEIKKTKKLDQINLNIFSELQEE